MHYDQVWFIPAVQSYFNIWKSVNVIYSSWQAKEENPYDQINRYREIFWQKPVPIHVKKKKNKQ